ncbi:MAG: HAMP domain-containing protein, partial [bacterium]
VMNYKEIIYSVIIDESGSILAIEDPRSMVTSRILDEALNLTAGKFEEIHTSGSTVYYNMVEPITFENERLGLVILGLSLEDLDIKLKQMRNKAIYIAFVSTLFVFACVFWGVDRLTRPIKDLDQAARKVSQGDLSQLVENKRDDELGRLAKSFNEMILRLKESQEEVSHYTQLLEKKIDERTYELRLSEQKYRTLFEHAGTAVALIDKNGKFLMVNKRLEDLSRYSKEELEGKITLSDFLSAVDCNKIKGLCNDNGKDEETGFPINHECTFIDRLNNGKNVNLTISLIPGTLKLLISIVDVTELRVLQKRLARSEHLAVLGELSAAIAHEIRNPLVAINTSVGILKNALDLNSEDDELMKIISEESMRLNKIVDDFLKFARPNEPQFTYTNVNSLIEEILVVLRSRFNENIQKDINLSDDLPEISADPNQLKQVVMNIFINAIEAMPAGGLLTVSTRYIKDTNRNSQPFLEVAIKDTGYGIEEQDLKKIFQPFYSNKAYGIGMGLAICERIIHNHGGQIRAESKTGEGSQFTLVLPV